MLGCLVLVWASSIRTATWSIPICAEAIAAKSAAIEVRSMSLGAASANLCAAPAMASLVISPRRCEFRN